MRRTTVGETVMPATRERLLDLLIQTKSFKWSPTPIFPLASGAMSSFYVDCRLGLSHAEIRQVVGELMLERVESPSDAVGGLLIGAYPIAIAVSDAAYRRGRDLRVFVVRKEPKSHGMKKLIEGDVAEGNRVSIVDDVITSGRSTIEAIEKSRDAGLIVTQALAIIDRQEQDGRARIEALGVPVGALCTLHELRERVGARPAGP
jgi:orotate phosphoribosyltransferase